MIEPKRWVNFDGDGIITHSKNIQGVLKVGTGNYIINPTDEQRYEQYRKDHPTKWDKIKRFFIRS